MPPRPAKCASADYSCSRTLGVQTTKQRSARASSCETTWRTSIIEIGTQQEPQWVFVYRRECVKHTALTPAMPYRQIQTINSTARQNASKSACLGDLHVHDLRLTIDMHPL